jgi:CRISPR system Cascade subunit CasD
MPGRILCFRLYGHLAAWGTSEAGNAVRPSARHPGRGAILGLLAAALGIKRDDRSGHDRLGAGLLVSVASHGPRRIVEDFRTVQSVEPQRNDRFVNRAEALARGRIHTSITQRQHVEDGLWRVFVTTRPDADLPLPSLANALRRPRFELYLGRREFPLALPPDPVVVDGDLENALGTYPAVPPINHVRAWSQLDRVYAELGRRVVDDRPWDLAWDVGFPGAPGSGEIRTVIDDPFSRTAWRFQPRAETLRRMGKYEMPKIPTASLVDEFFSEGEEA